MKRLTRLLIVITAWVSLVALACNLSSADTAPPTLVPRITDQILPTLGYSTPLPGEIAGPTATPAPPIGAQLYSILNQVDEIRLMETVYTLEGFYTRHVNSTQTSETQGVGAAARYLLNEFREISEQSQGNFRASEQPFTASYNGIDTSQRNIVGIIDGTEPNTPIIVIGAHYDSRTDELRDATGYSPGADDNGSGVAAVLEMARIMSQFRPKATLVFVLFSAEEVDRQGSKKFVREWLVPNSIPVQVMINVDTVGSINAPNGVVDDQHIRLFSPGETEDVASREMARMIDFIAFNSVTDLEIVKVDQADREGRYGDHFSFSEASIPAVRFIEAVEDTPNREGRDTSEHVESDYLRRATRTILTTVIALSDGPRPPSEVHLRDLGNGSRRLIWQPVEGATGYVVALRRAGDTYYAQRFPAVADTTAYDYDGFVSTRYTSLAVAAIDSNGIMGPLSPEYRIP